MLPRAPGAKTPQRGARTPQRGILAEPRPPSSCGPLGPPPSEAGRLRADESRGEGRDLLREASGAVWVVPQTRVQEENLGILLPPDIMSYPAV